MFAFVYLFFPSTEVGIIHEPEDELEEGQGLVVVALLWLGQERGLDGLTLHLPQVGFEVDVGPLQETETRHYDFGAIFD